MALTGLIAIATIVMALGGGLAGAGDTTSEWAIAGTIGALVSGGLTLAGLYKRTSDLVAGSWMTVIGALAGGPIRAARRRGDRDRRTVERQPAVQRVNPTRPPARWSTAA